MGERTLRGEIPYRTPFQSSPQGKGLLGEESDEYCGGAMSSEPSYEIVARGMTTRPVRIAGDQFDTVITRQALEGMARQVREGHVAMTPEHLSYLGPIGRWVDAEVVDLPDGHGELRMYGEFIDSLSPRHTDPPILLQLDDLPESEPPDVLDLTCSVELRIFEDADHSAIKESAPFALHHQHRWAELPPLEWVIGIPVLWGATKFAGAFFSELGRSSAEAVVEWFKKWSGRAQQNDRDWIVTLRFDLEDGSSVSGYIPVTAHDEQSARDLIAALESAGVVASLAGTQSERQILGEVKEVAVIYDHQDGWQLGWWTDGERVFKTLWFDKNKPAPERFLGRPLFESGSPAPSMGAQYDEEE